MNTIPQAIPSAVVVDPEVVQMGVNLIQDGVSMLQGMACAGLELWEMTPGRTEQALLLLESGVAELQVLSQQIESVRADLDHMVQRLGILLTVEWHSDAGLAFAERTVETRARAEHLRQLALDMTVLASAGMETIQSRIANARQLVTSLRQGIAQGLSGVVC